MSSESLVMRQKILDIALALFEQDGVDAISMRAIAARMEVSAMALYRYFANRQALLRALWLMVVDDLYGVLDQSVRPVVGAKDRQRVFVRSYLAYWMSHPQRFWLMYQMQSSPMEPVEAENFPQSDAYNASYRKGVLLLRTLAADLAHSVDTRPSPKLVNLAGDFCMSQMFGFLIAALVNRRFPWTNLAALKEVVIEQTVDSMIALFTIRRPWISRAVHTYRLFARAPFGLWRRD